MVELLSSVAIDPPAGANPPAAAAAGSAAEEASVARTLWETGVTAGGADVPDPGLFLLTFSRHSQELDDAVLACPLAAGLDPKPDWANGAKAPAARLVLWRRTLPESRHT